jgi:hypothetical protein
MMREDMDDALTRHAKRKARMGTKPWWESKTVWINSLTLIVLLLTTLADLDIPADWEKAVLGIVALLNVLLRFITSQTLRNYK